MYNSGERTEGKRGATVKEEIKEKQNPH